MANALTALKVKCPHCHIFLKDDSVQIDDRSSIKLDVAHDQLKGHIWLSSKYGSNSYQTDVDIPDESIIDFSCPHCHTNLENNIDCNKCGAPMASIQLSNGGVVNFCTRQGCSNNSIEFPELSFESNIEHEIEESEKLSFSLKRLFKPKEKIKLEQLRDEVLKRKTYLHSYCPHCNKGLTDNYSLSLKIITDDDKMGFLILSPYLGESMIKCTLNIEEGSVLKEIQCPYCDTNLVSERKVCRSCGSPVAPILVPADSSLVEFMICTKKGCLCHGLDKDDILDIKATYHTLAEKS